MSAQSPTIPQAAGIALAAQLGRVPKWHLQGVAKDMYNSMSMEELEELAETGKDDSPDKND